MRRHLLHLMMTSNAIRAALREVHRALIAVARADYERENGAIEGPAQLLRLLTDDPFFEWLRPLSRLIVDLDQRNDVPRPAVEALLRPGSAFGQRYTAALQADPHVAGSHARLRGALQRLEMN